MLPRSQFSICCRPPLSDMASKRPPPQVLPQFFAEDIEKDMMMVESFCSTLSLEDLEFCSVRLDDCMTSRASSPMSPSYVDSRPQLYEAGSDNTTRDNEHERLRRRQRCYEKRYRGRKRANIAVQRQTWLRLEIKLADARKKHSKALVRVGDGAPLRAKLLFLLLEERALRQDRVAMKSLCAWEEVSRIREYTDKEVLRTRREWKHNADKVFGQSSMLGPHAFNPYTPINFTFSW
ncbi:hypothetical protein F441_01636 [Phytophthora nicotianae CJ01A1]|nr:hypothetical protein F441_01636 [Phytophthora nicotianae CJ01A1]